jgi:hypothetical protein
MRGYEGSMWVDYFSLHLMVRGKMGRHKGWFDLDGLNFRIEIHSRVRA